MKKIFYSVLPVIFAYMLTAVGYAEGNITVGRAEVIDYVLFIGIGIFLIGIIMVLLSVFAGGRAKDSSEDMMDEYDDYEEYEEAEAEELYTEEEEEVLEEIEPEEEISEEAEEIAEIAEIEEPEEIEVEDGAQEIIAEPEEEEEPEAVVRITLTGVNNFDVKVMEFTDSITIGRKTFNDVVLEDKAVSGKHCEISFENGAVYITDLDSTNGTFVNDEPVVRSEIESGDTIIIGKNKYKINISM